VLSLRQRHQPAVQTAAPFVPKRPDGARHGTRPSKLNGPVRDSCPKVHCPGVQCHISILGCHDRLRAESHLRREDAASGICIVLSRKHQWTPRPIKRKNRRPSCTELQPRCGLSNWRNHPTYIQPLQSDQRRSITSSAGNYNPYTVATARARLDIEKRRIGNSMLQLKNAGFFQCYVVKRRADNAEIVAMSPAEHST
jgi:hypothetical protein